MEFPSYRGRRMRRTAGLRQLVTETHLRAGDLVWPMFVVEGKGKNEEIGAMPGVSRYSVDVAVEQAQQALALGIGGLILFGIPSKKDRVGSSAWDEQGAVQQAIRAIRRSVPEAVIMADACFCEYTDHGHCGVMRDGEVDNDATLENLGRLALSYAKAGVDVVAPSGMMDGAVGFMRESLDEEGFEHIALLGYSAKYASAFYGPFRDAAKSAPGKGHRRGYQMDPANANEALREVMMDVGEGADMVMVKPALSYLDVIARVRDEFNVPVVAYNVSGEYSMLRLAGEKGLLDYDAAMLEVLLSIKRAGAENVITYHAVEAAKLLERRR